MNSLNRYLRSVLCTAAAAVISVITAVPAAAQEPEIAVTQPAGVTNISNGGSKDFGLVPVGSPVSLVFGIENSGDDDLTGVMVTVDGLHPTDFLITVDPDPTVGPMGTTTFTVEFTPGASGVRTATLHIASNDADENPFDIDLTGTGAVPEIVVEQPATVDVPNGGSRDFGIVATGESGNLVFTIKNTGDANLTDLDITIDGTDATLFDVTADPTAPVSGPTGSTTFTVTFSPLTTGTKTATLHIENNDDDENPFDIDLTGEALDRGAALALDGVDDAVEIPANAAFSTPTFTIEGWVKPSSGMDQWTRLWGTQNNQADLIVRTGADNRFSFAPVINGAYVYATAPTSWTPGQWYHVAGVLDHNMIRLYVDGVQVSAVAYTGTWAGDAGGRYIGKSTSPSRLKGVVDDVRYWNYARNCDQIEQTYEGELTGAESGLVAYYPLNQGWADSANAAVLTATDATGHGHTGALQNFSLADGNSTSNWTSPGGVVSGDLADPPIFAEVDVTGNGVSINDGDTTPNVADHTDFGTTSALVTRTFTIQNTGNANLTVTSITLTGPTSGAFALGGFTPGTIVAGGGLTTFTLTVGPTVTDVRMATVTIVTDDCDEGSYDFAIQSIPPYDITTTANSIAIADPTAAGGTLNVENPGAGLIKFTNTIRSFSLNGGVPTFADSGNLALAGITSITVTGGGGNETINVNAFAALPNLTVNGGTGGDTVNFTGDIVFTAGSSLDADLQNDAVSPGADTVNLTDDADLSVSGSGTVTIRTSKSANLATGASITGSNGNLIVEANQQAVSSTGRFVGITLAGGSITSTGTGTILLIGKGGTTGEGNYGVYLSDGATVASTSAAGGAGTVTVSGTGGTGTNNHHGVYLDGAASNPVISAAAGAIQVSGTGGTTTGSGSRGVFLSAGGSITGTVGSTVTVTGVGGSNGTSTRSGVTVTGAGSQITSVNGAITLTGTGGAGGSGNSNTGIAIEGGALVSATGSGSILLDGTEGAGVSAIEGIRIAGASTVETNAGTGNITLTADRIFLDPVNAMINGGANTVTLRQRTAGRAIGLGGVDSATLLGLQDNELDTINAATINIGNGSSGGITQTVAITRPIISNINLTSGGDISFNAFTVDTLGGNLSINPTGVFTPINSGVDVTLGTGTLSLGGSGRLSLAIDSAISNTKLDMTGAVNLTGTTLVLTGSYVPLKGQTFVLVNNDGADAVTGSFAGLAEGTMVVVNGVAMSISYVGGTGNDVTLAYATPVVTAAKSSMTVAEAATATNSGAFTDLQGNVVSMNVNVGTLVPNLGGGTWTWSHVPPDGPLGPITVTVTATDNSTPPLTGSVSFTYTVTNVAPVAQAHSVTVFEDSGATAITLPATDAGVDTLTYSIVTQPAAAKGTLSAPSGNIVQFTPAAGATGAASFTFRATDSDGAVSNAATVSLTITPVNDAPTFVKGADRAHPPQFSSAQNVAAWASSLNDGDPESIQTMNFTVTQIAGLPGLFTTAPSVSSSGNLSYQPNGASGWARFAVRLHDNGGILNGGVDTSAPQTVTIRVGHAQVIDFPPLADKVYEDPPFEVSATGGGSGNPVTFSIVSGPATISDATVTITGAGVVTVRANQAEGGDYAQAEDTDRSFTVARAPQEITFTNPGTHTFGEVPFALTSTGGNSALPVTYEIVSGPATVSGDMVTLTGIGDVTVRANQAGNANYLPADPVEETFASAVFSDYTVITWDGAIRVYDNSGNGDTLTVSETGANTIKFAAPGRSFSVNAGSNIAGDSGTLSLAGKASVTVHNAGGADTMNIGALSGPLPNVIINGGTGADTINFNGNLTFSANASLDLDLQNDDATPGADSVNLGTGAVVGTTGTGTITVRVSKSVSLGTNSVLSTVNGNLTVEANQQLVATGGNSIGINLSQGTIRSTGSGIVTVKGKGGNSSLGSQIGVRVQNGGVISGATGSPVVVVGTGGASTAANNFGVQVTGAGSVITSTGGSLEVQGVEGGGTTGNAIFLQSSAALSSSGPLLLTGNSMNFDGTVSVTATGSSVTLLPLTPGVGINLGAVTNVVGGPLSLTDAELGRITAATLNIGNAASGAMVVSAPITRAASTAINLASAGSINVDSGPISSGGGNIVINPGSSVGADSAGVDVNAGSGTLSFASGDILALAINGTVVNTGYQQLNVAGVVNLTGVTLSLSGSFTPPAGTSFTLVNNDGVDAIVGTFAGLPQRAVVMVQGVAMEISYTGGTGNDVTLSTAAPVVAANSATVTVNEGTTATNSGTFSDLQGNATAALTANIGTVIQNNGAGTWSWSYAAADGPQASSVTITATDDSTPPRTATATFALNVTNVAPTAQAQTVSVLEDSGATQITLQALEPGVDTLTYAIVASPTAGTGTLSGFSGNTVNFTPTANYAGTATFTFRATDSDGAVSNTATVTVNVASVNDRPTFTIGANRVHGTGFNSAQTVPSWATAINDNDPEAVQSLSFNVTEIGSSGMFTTFPSITSAGTLAYRTNGNAGTATLAVLLTDSGGIANGGQDTSTVQLFTIFVAPDTAPPTVAVSAPAANANVAENLTTHTVTVSGSAADNKALSKVEVQLNGGGYVDATSTIAANGLTATFTTQVAAPAGLNTIDVRSVDTAGNMSTVVTRSFTHVVLRPLTVHITPVGGGTVTYSPALSAGKAQVGVSYTITATASAGHFFENWTGTSVTAPPDTSTQQTFVMTEVIGAAANPFTANFMATPFSAGSYAGLAKAAAGTTPSVHNLAYFTATTTSTGSFTGTVNFDGTNSSLSGVFDRHTGDATGSTATLSYDLHLDLTGGTDKVTGTVTQTASGDVSDVDADLDTFNASNHVPDQFLKPGDNTKNGVFTVVFPGQTTDATYPKGHGYGTITVTPLGVVSIAGTLADGTAISTSAPLSKTYAWPLIEIIKPTASVAGVTFGGMVQFDTTPADSDVTASGLDWFRPVFASATHYPDGWPAGVSVSLTGAHFVNPVGSSVVPDLDPPDGDGNAELEFSEGLLTGPILKTVNIASNNAVTEVPADTSFTLTVTGTTGALSGSFTHTGSATIKPVIKGVVLQKGANKGGWGFFLSPVPAGSPTPGESGMITLSKQ